VNPKIVMVGGVGLIITVAGFVYAAQPKEPARDFSKLAQCLADKQVTMYGAYWCPHCQAQKKAFGEAWKYVPYVECTQETQKCLDKNVKGYPTWIFPDGKRLEGEQSLDKLAQESGCELE